MQLTVHSQISFAREYGDVRLTAYGGADTRPYIDESLFFVADGMGGASGMKHRQFDRALFDEEKFMDVLFEGIYEDYSDERFEQYVRASFFEFFAVKPYYFEDNFKNTKDSGYFASRLVSAILLHEMIYNPECNAEKIFGELSALESESEREEYIAALGDHFKEVIYNNLHAIAKKVNFFYESKMAKLQLLGTTLTATIYLEHEDSVEAIYLCAGDSRAYLWNEKEGLCQLFADQERPDGGLSNFICATPGGDFDIVCSYRKFTKPCVLFNASDGCFDLAFRVPSYLPLEKSVLDFISSSETPEEAAEKMGDYFKSGNSDDSATVAMKMFGYESYDALKECMKRRLSVIDEEYFTEMPDLCSCNYLYQYKKIGPAFAVKLAEIKTAFESEAADALGECSKEMLAREGYPAYLKRIEEIEARKAEAVERLCGASIMIEEIVRSNFCIFDGREGTPFSNERKARRLDEEYRSDLSAYDELIINYKSGFEAAVAAISLLLEDICLVETPSGYEEYPDIDIKKIAEYNAMMKELFKFLNCLGRDRYAPMDKLFDRRKKYLELNAKIAEEEPEKIVQIREGLERGEIAVEDFDILDSEKACVTNALSVISDAKSIIAHCDGEAREAALDEFMGEFWEARFVDIIVALVEAEPVRISDELADTARHVVGELREQENEIKKKSEFQERLLAKYSEGYYKYMEDNAE